MLCKLFNWARISSVCFVCLFVCVLVCRLFVCLNAHLDSDGIRLEQKLKPGCKASKACWPNGLCKYKETEASLKIGDEEKEEDNGYSQQIKLNNFTVSLWDKRKGIFHPISTATEVTWK